VNLRLTAAVPNVNFVKWFGGDSDKGSHFTSPQSRARESPPVSQSEALYSYSRVLSLESWRGFVAYVMNPPVHPTALDLVGN
jgi:hypothetical protein